MGSPRGITANEAIGATMAARREAAGLVDLLGELGAGPEHDTLTSLDRLSVTP